MDKKNFALVFLFFVLLSACQDKETVSEYEQNVAGFSEGIGGTVSPGQWWRTAVKIHVLLESDAPAQLWLTSEPNEGTVFDYKQTNADGIVTMTAPQGYGNPLYLSVFQGGKLSTHTITLSGKSDESVTTVTSTKATASSTRGGSMLPESLCGESIYGNPHYYEFSKEELREFHSIMDIVKTNGDAKKLGLNTRYEIKPRGPFEITWVSGYEELQTSHILGYFYHSPDTYEDIVYQDLCETHKWDYIDGMAKVQYQLSTTLDIDGYTFLPHTWYDANFDMLDFYGSTRSRNMDRIGDNAYNMQVVYTNNTNYISALRGLTFKIDVPEDKYVGFYLRSDEDVRPDQWSRLVSRGIKPYTDKSYEFKGTNFSIEDFNFDGTHRSFIHSTGRMRWIGMEDRLGGGDRDCNDVVFGLEGDFDIVEPIVVPPAMPEGFFPWTLAFEDIYRGSDYDFNDAVIRLEPDPVNETCRVSVMAAGSTDRMYLHYSGPDGDDVLGEIHELMAGRFTGQCINTMESAPSVPFVELSSVPWPADYTMANDAKRFWIEIRRGDCEDCMDVLALTENPGEKMPSAMLVAGEWSWPMEGVPVYSAYTSFKAWAKDVTRTEVWSWHRNPARQLVVTY